MVGSDSLYIILRAYFKYRLLFLFAGLFEGAHKLVQLAFLSKIGAPVAFCIFKSGKDAATAVKSARLRGLSASSWSRDGYEYILIGGSDDKLITAAAEVLARKI